MGMLRFWFVREVDGKGKSVFDLQLMKQVGFGDGSSEWLMISGVYFVHWLMCKKYELVPEKFI